MLPTLTKDETKVLGELVREHRKSLGLTLAEYTKHVREKLGVQNTEGLSPWDVASLESRGLGLRYIPLMHYLVDEDILTREATDAVLSARPKSLPNGGGAAGPRKGTVRKAKDPKPTGRGVRHEPKGRGGSRKSGKSRSVATD